MLGDLLTMRKYDNFNHLNIQSSSSMTAVLSRLSNGEWQTQYSYNSIENSNPNNRFPNLVQQFSSDFLNGVLTQNPMKFIQKFTSSKQKA